MKRHSSAYNFSYAYYKEKSRTSNVLSGLGAGVTEALTFVIPGETIKTKLIHDKIAGKNKYRGLIHGTKAIIAEKGFGGIYKGVIPTVLRQGSNQAVRFFVYEEASSILEKSLKMPHALAIFLAGGIAGAASVYGMQGKSNLISKHPS